MNSIGNKSVAFSFFNYLPDSIFFKMKNIFLVFLISTFAFVNAQTAVTQVKVGVDGITCSMCSKGTEKSIRRLAFVQDVVMELNTAEAAITIKWTGGRFQSHRTSHKGCRFQCSIYEVYIHRPFIGYHQF